MMDYGGMIGAAISATASHINNGMNILASRSSAHKNYQYSKKLFDYQNRYNNLQAPSDYMQGLANAGINPLMAYGNVGSASGNIQAANFMDAPKLDSGLEHIGKAVSELSLRNSALENEKVQREVSKRDATVREMGIKLQERGLEQNKELNDSVIRLNDAKRLSELEVPNFIKSQIERNSASALLAKSQAERASDEKNLVLARIGLTEAQKKYLESQHATKSHFNLNLGLLGNYGFDWTGLGRGDTSTPESRNSSHPIRDVFLWQNPFTMPFMAGKFLYNKYKNRKKGGD